MRRYKIPENTKEIIITDDGVVCIIVKKLIKIFDDWKVIAEQSAIKEEK